MEAVTSPDDRGSAPDSVDGTEMADVAAVALAAVGVAAVFSLWVVVVVVVVVVELLRLLMLALSLSLKRVGAFRALSTVVTFAVELSEVATSFLLLTPAFPRLFPFSLVS
jgi:hypothetical protein